jgi:uncharacterized heparinase superfamily protein
LGNHLFANAKALVYAGLFFVGDEADTWLGKGLKILAREIPEQILPDGGQFERSPMYQALAVEDMLDLINIANAYGKKSVPNRHRQLIVSWPAIAAKMCQWLSALCHPDGDISFFNDAALGIAPRLSALNDYAGRLGLDTTEIPKTGIVHLKDSGYIRLGSDEAVALLDVAPIGPDYIPGHAHADTLSFELSLFDRRILVNSGTSVYDTSGERQRQRGTPAHNTVVIDKQNSSEVWAGFRVARRARPFALKIRREDRRNTSVSCAHDGYRRLPGKPIHRRCWQFSPEGLKVSDAIQGDFRHAQARFHFHPECNVRNLGKDFGVDLTGGKKLKIAVAGGQAAVEPCTWHPEFGLNVKNQCLSVTFKGNQIETIFSWH